MNIYTSKPSGTYTAGDCIYIVFDFSREIAFSQLPDPYSQPYLDSIAAGSIPTGTPYIELNSMAFVPLVGYASDVDKRKLLFRYNVGPGEYTPVGKSLGVPAGVSIALNGGTIQSLSTGLDIDLASIPDPGDPGALDPAGGDILYISKTGDKPWEMVMDFLAKSKARV